MRVETLRELVLVLLLDIGGSDCRPVNLQDIWSRFKVGKIIVPDELHGETFGQSTYTHWIRSTLSRLKTVGCAENVGRGLWVLTSKGLQEANYLRALRTKP